MKKESTSPPSLVTVSTQRLVSSAESEEDFSSEELREALQKALSDGLPQEEAWSPAQKEASPGRYQIEEQHAEGGLGRIYRAIDLQLQREVAVKELKARSASARERFFQEALITAKLQHPSIVPIYEVGVWPPSPRFAWPAVERSPPSTRVREDLRAQMGFAVDVRPHLSCADRDLHACK